jgi:hypothetical protein
MEISKLMTGSKKDHEVQKRIASEPKRERGGARMGSLTLKMVTKVVEKQLPVRSALVKQCIARLVLWWVTTWESLVL